MKLLLGGALSSLVIGSSVAFVAPSVPSSSSLTVVEMGYVPDGMSPEQYRQLRNKEKTEQSKKKFGAFGPQSFKSRSLQSFQTELEQGKAGHLMPMFNAKQKLKAGAIKQEDVPYMQRGGHWDNSDVKSAKKRAWNKLDKDYKAKGTGEGRGPNLFKLFN